MDAQGDYLYMSFLEGLDQEGEEIEAEIEDLRCMLEDKVENIDSQVMRLLDDMKENHRKDLDEMLSMFSKSNDMQDARFRKLITRINASAGNKIISQREVKQMNSQSQKAKAIFGSQFLKKFESVNS